MGPTGAKSISRNHALIKADVITDKWEESLLQAGFDPCKPAVWLMEGLLPYLPEAEVDRLLKRIRSLSAAGSYLGADHPSQKVFQMSVAKDVLNRLDELKAPLVSVT